MMSDIKYCYEVGYKSTEDIPRIHADMKALGGVVTAVRFGPMDEDDQSRAPAVKWRDGEPPEGVEVLAQVDAVRWRGTEKEERFSDTYLAYTERGDLVHCDSGDSTGWTSECVTRYIPLSELLPKE
jgi:hypothetical protein